MLLGKKNELGLGELEEGLKKPELIPYLSNIKQVSCGAFHSLALTEDGKVFMWGSGGMGTVTNLTPTLLIVNDTYYE